MMKLITSRGVAMQPRLFGTCKMVRDGVTEQGTQHTLNAKRGYSKGASPN